MISAGAVPKAILSRQAVELGAELALRPQQPGDAAIEAVEHAGADDAGQRLRPVAGDREPHPGQAEAQCQQR